MVELSRRGFLRSGATVAGAAAAMSALPASIRDAMAVAADVREGTIKDVDHVVILMQENRSFDHYFGSMRGVRGFGDRFPIPLESGKRVWYQSDGEKEVPPFHLDKDQMNAIKIHTTAHNFPDAQAAWGQGKLDHWPLYKYDYMLSMTSGKEVPNGLSMGHYRRKELPFQFALAEAFTICDAYHCSVQSGTDPNRITFFSGSNFDPELRAQGINCTDADSEPVNLRSWIKGTFPDPGYTYRANAFRWPTIPDVLQEAGISWRIYQDPNDNWSGAMHGGLAFESFRAAEPGSPIYRNGLEGWSLEDLATHVEDGTLPQVSWILPSQAQSEHAGGSSALSGADFTNQVLKILTSNTKTWSRTVFFLTFDENDGFFDHMPPPAVPSYRTDGSLAGASTIPVDGMYFRNDKGEFADPVLSDMMNRPIITRYCDPRDNLTGDLRPWGMGPRVPMYIISPWSKGGWVDSEVFDHTSVGQFLERRFDITIPAISPWHRSIAGDLTSAFDFKTPNDPRLPKLPDTAGFAVIEAQQLRMPAALPPAEPEPFWQEPGVRYSRALPYDLDTIARPSGGGLELVFANKGKAGAVFHVYDLLHLGDLPRRYTVEPGLKLADVWDAGADDGRYAMEVHGPNGWFRKFAGSLVAGAEAGEQSTGLNVKATARGDQVVVRIRNVGPSPVKVTTTIKQYIAKRPWRDSLKPGEVAVHRVSLRTTGRWYDISVTSRDIPGFERRFAGRFENGRASTSDPAMAAHLSR